MGYGGIVDSTMEALASTGLLRDPGRSASHARMMVDMVAGTLIRAGGDFPMDRLRSELHHGVDLFLEGVLRPA
jgi:hypothetical protein